jgi:CubicO group peptidase (beta-lactamase class C family)
MITLKSFISPQFIVLLLFSILLASYGEYAFQMDEMSVTQKENNYQDRLFKPNHDPTNVSDIQSFMDTLIEQQLEEYHIPGAAITVVNNTNVIFSKGYGFADLADNRFVEVNSTMFRAASVSKLLVWTAVMQLYEQGKIDLDEDINTYLTDFQIPDTFSEPITMNHLMAHAAGFEEKILAGAPRTEDNLLPLGEYLKTRMPARIITPGKVSIYSNYGAALAGYIVAQIENTTFNDYIEDNIFTPLNMTLSTFQQPIPQALEDNLAQGYYYDYDNEKFEAIPFIYLYETPAGALSSTATDMAKFMIAHLNNGSYKGSQILQPSTNQFMHTQHFTMDPRITGFAHGFMEMVVNNKRVIWHGGDLGSTHTALVLIPEENIGFYVCYNSGSSARYNLFREFFDHYYPVPDTEPIAPPADFKERARKFTGYYHSMRNAYISLMAAPNLIFTTYHIGVADDGALLILGERYCEIDDLLFRHEIYNEIIAFREDSNGKITHFFINNNPTNTFEKMTGLRSIPLIIITLVITLLGYLAVPITELVYFIIRKVKKEEKAEEPTLAIISRWTSIGLTIITIVFIVGTTLVLLLAQIWFEVPPILMALLVIPFLMILATGALLVFNVFMWKDHHWDAPKRIIYTTSTVLSIVFLIFLGYWNLIGFNY